MGHVFGGGPAVPGDVTHTGLGCLSLSAPGLTEGERGPSPPRDGSFYRLDMSFVHRAPHYYVVDS